MNKNIFKLSLLCLVLSGQNVLAYQPLNQCLPQSCDGADCSLVEEKTLDCETSAIFEAIGLSGELSKFELTLRKECFSDLEKCQFDFDNLLTQVNAVRTEMDIIEKKRAPLDKSEYVSSDYQEEREQNSKRAYNEMRVIDERISRIQSAITAHSKN